MKKFVFLAYGYEKPTKEIMEAWGQWLASIKDSIVDQGHFGAGIELTQRGTNELPLDKEAITGYLIFKAKDINEAEKIAKRCPIITSNRVYEIMSM